MAEGELSVQHQRGRKRVIGPSSRACRYNSLNAELHGRMEHSESAVIGLEKETPMMVKGWKPLTSGTTRKARDPPADLQLWNR